MTEKDSSPPAPYGEPKADELHRTLCDAKSGWRYIRETHGDLYGVGWDRVEQRLSEQIEISAARLKAAHALSAASATRASILDECIERLSTEYADPERFSPDADIYNSAVGYCIGALIAMKDAAPVAQEPVAGFVRPFAVRHWNTPLADTGDYCGHSEVHDANGKQAVYWGDDLDNDEVDAIAQMVCNALNAATSTHRPEELRISDELERIATEYEATPGREAFTTTIAGELRERAAQLRK